MPKISVRNDESLDQALRRFNREVLKDGIIQEVKKREYYEKPSVVKKHRLAERERVIRQAKRRQR